MAKKRKRKATPFKQGNRTTYNTAKPNRQARRLGVEPIEPLEREEPKRVSKAAVLSQKVQQAKEMERRIALQGMTYGEYMAYLKEKRQQLEEKQTRGKQFCHENRNGGGTE